MVYYAKSVFARERGVFKMMNHPLRSLQRFVNVELVITLPEIDRVSRKLSVFLNNSLGNQ